MEKSVKLSVRALAANMKVSVEKLAEIAEIDPVHLRNVSLGRARMTATELVRLSLATNISPFNIETEFNKET